MQIQRRDPLLNEALDILDLHLEHAEGDIRKAYLGLGPTEKEFIDAEIERIQEYRYYAENYHVIATEAEGLKTLYPFWDSQEIFYEVVFQLQSKGLPVKVLILKARQLGLSTIAESLIFHKTIITEACNTLIVAQDPTQADYLFGMSRLAYDSLPWWMKPEARYDAKGRWLVFDRKDPTERMLRPGLRSRILVEAANKMTGVGVGKSVRASHMSELSDWRSASTLTEQLFPTMNAPDALIILESTARGRKNFWHTFWKAAVEGRLEGVWTPVFIEFFRVKKYFLLPPKGEEFTLTEDESAIRAKVKENTGIKISDGQLYWRRKKMAEFSALQGDPFKFYQEYPSTTWMEAFQGSGVCAFNKKRLHEILETTCCDPIYYGEAELNEISGGYRPKIKLRQLAKDKEAGLSLPPAEDYGTRLRVWELPKEGESYYIAADVAHGVQGGNHSCGQVFKIGKGPEPDVQVAEWRGWINPTPYAYTLVALGYWYNTAQIAVECNDVGLTTSNHIFRVLNYPNVFRWKHYDKLKNFMTDFFGWYTNSKTRPMIISKFREAIDEGTLIIRSEALIDECLDFSSIDGVARFEGQEDDDDRVLAAMITNFCAHDTEWGQMAASTPREERPKDQDFANTDWSLIHDQPGWKSGQTERDIPGDVLVYSDNSEPGGEVPFEDRWKLY